jgi:predicted DNA-binding protein (MmcQ/YjbR family)
MTYVKVKVYPNDYIKVRVEHHRDLGRLLSVANAYCLDKSNWNKVLLMPEYREDSFAGTLLNRISRVHQGVRFMPPVQNILNIP